jgi:hypothetical protein
LRQAAPIPRVKKYVIVIRVRVPLDLHAISSAGSAAFALATPLRVHELLALAVREAIGARAPYDKFQRSLSRMIAGLAAGDFTVDIDGRMFTSAHTVVMCERTALVRFFVSRGTTADLEFQP